MPGAQGIDRGSISSSFQQAEADQAWMTQEQARHQSQMTTLDTISKTQSEDAKMTRESVQSATKPS
jgi:hypothetical protein